MALLTGCNPRMIRVDDSCGCTLTRASITALTPTALENFGVLEVDAHRIIGNEKELRRTGVREKTLRDLLLSRMVGLPRTNLGTNRQSIIAPFVLKPQRHNVNSNWWTLVAGAADPAAGTGTVHAGSVRFTVRNSGGQFSTALVDLEKYFLVGRYIAVLTRDPVTQVGRKLQFKITASVNADSGGVEQALITVEPPYSAAGWVALSAAQKAVFEPHDGIIINLANSVSDYESYCYQYPAENTLKLRDFWVQTIRTTWCYSDEYIKALNAPLTSSYWKKFATLPLAEQRKRQGYQDERDFFNTVFYGQRITEKQTADTYTQLPQVVDPLNTTCLLEYKANTLGIRTQLSDCGRVIDFQGAPLDLDLLKELLYAVKRHREIDSGTITRLDGFTDRFTFGLVRKVMIDYYKDSYGADTTRFYQPKQALVFQNQVLWDYDIFEFPEDGFELALFRDDYFDDHLSAFPTAMKAAGRQLLIIDWSDVNLGVGNTRSVNRQTNIADNAYNCVIQPNVTRYQLKSQQLAVMVEDPNRHLIMENFSGDCPIITATTCAAGS